MSAQYDGRREMNSTVSKFRTWRSLLPVFTAFILLGLTKVVGAEGNSTSLKMTDSFKIPLLGYIEQPEYFSIANQIETDYLSGITNNENNRVLARALVAFIGPSLVESGEFVPPQNFYLPPDQLEVMAKKTFSNEGCRIERLIFPAERQFIVLLVDASDNPSQGYIESCMLAATLTALGKDLNGQPQMTNAELRSLIKRYVNGE